MIQDQRRMVWSPPKEICLVVDQAVALQLFQAVGKRRVRTVRVGGTSTVAGA